MSKEEEYIEKLINLYDGSRPNNDRTFKTLRKNIKEDYNQKYSDKDKLISEIDIENSRLLAINNGYVSTDVNTFLFGIISIGLTVLVSAINMALVYLSSLKKTVNKIEVPLLDFDKFQTIYLANGIIAVVFIIIALGVNKYITNRKLETQVKKAYNILCIEVLNEIQNEIKVCNSQDSFQKQLIREEQMHKVLIAELINTYKKSIIDSNGNSENLGNMLKLIIQFSTNLKELEKEMQKTDRVEANKIINSKENHSA
jgi:hypothetical protein